MSDSSNSGIEFTGLLTIVFITLKLTKVIDWSWWWIMSPIWITAMIILLILIVMLCCIIWGEQKMGVYRSINFTITGQVKDETDGDRTAKIIEAELNLLASKYGLELEGNIGW